MIIYHFNSALSMIICSFSSASIILESDEIRSNIVYAFTLLPKATQSTVLSQGLKNI